MNSMAALQATNELAVLEARADEVARRLSLMANAKRLLILCTLARGEASVTALQQALDIGQSALSQHLAKLRDGGVVATRREAQTIFYRLADAQTVSLMEALYDTFCAGEGASLP